MSANEALEQYQIYKNKYSDAYYEQQQSQRREQQLDYQKREATSQLGGLSTQKLNFEKRLEGIVNIIKALEGSSGWCAINVPDSISKVASKLEDADNSYKKSIVCTGGNVCSSLSDAFSVSTVDADTNSSSALQKFIIEKNRLEQAIEDLRQQIANLTELISSLTSQIRFCNETQTALKHTMNTCAYEMNYYRKRMYE